MLQWYANVPGVLKVKLTVEPGAEDMLNSPDVSDVTVWFTWSLFVQVTVSPALTVMEAGLKAMFWMLTLAVAARATETLAKTASRMSGINPAVRSVRALPRSARGMWDGPPFPPQRGV